VSMRLEGLPIVARVKVLRIQLTNRSESFALGNLKDYRYNLRMAQRRMLSLRIVDSARFLQMPLTAHALYFHLALHADDDGVVESFPVMRTTGAAQDDLKILLAKKFIHQLNDDLVVFVTDWREHNFIRADRKTDSVYKDLLLRVVPEASVIQPKPRTDVRDNSRRISEQPYLQPMDSPRTVHGRHRLGKVSSTLSDQKNSCIRPCG
jgi:hypothetical protein